jgi:hypothetical protein
MPLNLNLMAAAKSLLRPVSAHGCGAKTSVDRLEIPDLDPICTVGKRRLRCFFATSVSALREQEDAAAVFIFL